MDKLISAYYQLITFSLMLKGWLLVTLIIIIIFIKTIIHNKF